MVAPGQASKEKKTVRLVKESDNQNKIKYLFIGIVIGILIGIAIFYILMSFGIIRPFFMRFMRPERFTRPGTIQ